QGIRRAAGAVTVAKGLTAWRRTDRRHSRFTPTVWSQMKRNSMLYRTRIGAVAGCLAVSGRAALRAQGAVDGSPPPFPPPGRLIDVGGWRLHLNCTGTASPTKP